MLHRREVIILTWVTQESYGASLYSDEATESYYGQRSLNAMASVSANASTSGAQAYAYYQPTQFSYARNPSYPPQQSAMNIITYSSMGYCRPSALHNQDSGSESNFSHFSPPQPSLYDLAVIENPYTLNPTSNPSAFQYGLEKGSWYNTEPQINTDVQISPAMAGATMVSQLSSQWNQSFGSDSSPSTGDGSARYASYQSSELSFSDSDEECNSERSRPHKVLKSNDKGYESRNASQGRHSHEMDMDDSEFFVKPDLVPIAPQPNPESAIMARFRRVSTINSVLLPSFTNTSQDNCGFFGVPQPSTPATRQSTEHQLFRPRTSTSARDQERDDLLIQLKRQGYSYKDIKKRGNFKEAESTLRGRYRTLTKSKEERVRRPCWTDKDLRLLREGVMRFGGANGSGDVNIVRQTQGGQMREQRESRRSGGNPAQYGKVKWMLVAQYIKEKGGSYHFGNATCRKKWDELCKMEREKGKREHVSS